MLSEPPFTEIAFASGRVSVAWPSVSVPELTVVDPVYVLVPLRIRVPAPSMLMPNPEAAGVSDTTPREKVPAPPALQLAVLGAKLEVPPVNVTVGNTTVEVFLFKPT